MMQGQVASDGQAQPVAITEQERQEQGLIPNGPAAAAILASGIGCTALGVFVILTEAVPFVKTVMNFYDPVGPLSGKTTMAVVVWVVAWFLLHGMWKRAHVNFAWIFRTTLILIALGLLLAFPPFYSPLAELLGEGH
jgi:hypothetical protein